MWCHPFALHVDEGKARVSRTSPIASLTLSSRSCGWAWTTGDSPLSATNPDPSPRNPYTLCAQKPSSWVSQVSEEQKRRVSGAWFPHSTLQALQAALLDSPLLQACSLHMLVTTVSSSS